MTAKEFVLSVFPNARFEKLPDTEDFLIIEYEGKHYGSWALIKASKRESVQWNDAKRILNARMMRKLAS